MDSSSEIEDRNMETPNLRREAGPNRQSLHAPIPSKKRSRVTRACNRCKLRRMRCTGKQPCPSCTRSGAPCEFTAKYTRGVAPPIEISNEVVNRENHEVIGGLSTAENLVSSTRESSELVQDGSDEYSVNMSTERESRSVLEPSRTFDQTSSQRSGQKRRTPPDYEDDPSTGTAVFERTQINLNNRVFHKHKSSIFTYGDPPLPEVYSSFFTLPPPEIAQAIVAKYFNYASGINRYLHQPTVNSWLDEMLSSFRGTQTGADGNSKRAVVLMVLASAYDLVDFGSKQDSADQTFRFFQQAEQQLKTETGELRLGTIQARLLQCFYLLGRSRVNQCWSIFGTIVNLIFAMGIHRKFRVSGGSDLINVECSKRTFWAVYTLDKYLSSALGRPEMFHPDDFDQELPALVDDENLTSSNMLIIREGSSCTMIGTVLQNKLAIIISKILKKFYKIKSPVLEVRHRHTEKIEGEFAIWAEEASIFINSDPHSLNYPLSRFQSFALRLSYSHAQILLYRPFLLEKQIFREDPDVHIKTGEYINGCLAACMRITEMLNEASRRRNLFSSSWFVHFVGYTAVVALYVYVIKYHSEPSEKWMPYFEAATTAQARIKISAEKESFAQKCSVVLEELHTEAVTCIQKENADNEANERRDTNTTYQSMFAQPQDTYSQSLHMSQATVPSSNQAGLANPNLMSSRSFFGGEWNDMNFDQSAPGGGILGSLFQGLDGIQVRDPFDSVVDRIDRWGFSSLTGY